MGIVKNNTSTGQLACGRGLEETVFYPGSRRKLVEKSRERHVLNCEFGIWMGGECWANHALEGIWGWGRLALTSHPGSLQVSLSLHAECLEGPQLHLS